MKKTLLALALLSFPLALARADTNAVGAASSIPALTVKRISAFTTLEQRPSRRLLGMRVRYGGAVTVVVQDRESIFHPSSDPDARTAAVLENVSINPRTGRAEGIGLFSIKF